MLKSTKGDETFLSGGTTVIALVNRFNSHFLETCREVASWNCYKTQFTIILSINLYAMDPGYVNGGISLSLGILNIPVV